MRIITKEIIDSVNCVQGIANKRSFLMNYIGSIDESKKMSATKHQRLVRFRNVILSAKSITSLEKIMWNSLLSSEGMRV